MAVNPKTVALLAQIARQYGPTLARQLGSVLDDRQSASGARPAGSGPASGLGTLAGAAGLVGGTAQQAFQAARGVAHRRSADGRLEAKLDVLTELVEQAQPGTALHAQAQASRPKLEALQQKRALVLRAYSGRERTRALREVQAGVDELLQQFLAATDEQLG